MHDQHITNARAAAQDIDASLQRRLDADPFPWKDLLNLFLQLIMAWLTKQQPPPK